ncbi:MAG: hypothetical protein AB7F08_10605 [Dongiaceae bacterium]
MCVPLEALTTPDEGKRRAVPSFRAIRREDWNAVTVYVLRFEPIGLSQNIKETVKPACIDHYLVQAGFIDRRDITGNLTSHVSNQFGCRATFGERANHPGYINCALVVGFESERFGW